MFKVEIGALYLISHLILKFLESSAIIMAFQRKKIKHIKVK